MPEYSSVGLPPENSLSVGKPDTPNSSAREDSTVASTLAIRMPSGLSIPAALAYSGARVLQCPHLQVSNIYINRVRLSHKTVGERNIRELIRQT